MTAERAGVLGGTFDPPHLAHLVLAACARQQLSLDRVVFVPAGEPWRKSERHISAAAARLRMVRAAIDHTAWCEVSTVDIDRAGPTYSFETMRELAAAGGEWWFLLGADALDDMQHWLDPAALIATARLGVATRGGERVTAPEALRQRVPAIDTRIDVVRMSALDISSTALRRRIAHGERTEVVLDEAVRAIADELGLYAPAP